MSETSPRAGLYARLSEVLGVEHAGTLMSYLPGEEPADKNDIRRLEDRIDRFEDRMDRFEDRMDRFETRFDRFDDRLDNFHTALRDQIRTFALVSVASILTTAALVAGIVQALVSSR